MYYTLFHRPRPTALKYLVNRCSKIFFLYWVALIVLYLVLPFKLDSSFLKTFLLIPGHDSVIGVSWSLSYELYFYFLIGIVVYLMPGKYQNFIFSLLFTLSSVITIINLTPLTFKGTFINFLLGPNFWEFLLGIASALLSIYQHKKIRPDIALLAASLGFLLLIVVAIPYSNVFSHVVYGPLSFLTVSFFAIYEEEISITKKVSNFSMLLGDASYAIYLFGPIFTLLVTPDSCFLKWIVVFSTICFSVVFNRLVERRFLTWSRKMIYNKKECA